MAEADKTAYWIVEPGSFAYNPARINVGSIGYLATRENVIVSSLYEVFRSDETCDDRFLWHWLKSALFAKQIEALQEGGVRLYFFFDKLLKSEITMPSIREQSIIGSLFDRLDSLIALHQRERVEWHLQVEAALQNESPQKIVGTHAHFECGNRSAFESREVLARTSRIQAVNQLVESTELVEAFLIRACHKQL